MKKQHTYMVWIACLVCAWLPVSGQHVQDKASGIWKGLFWEEYATVLQLDLSNPDIPSGTIQMFDSESKIQDDGLARIRVEDHRLFFYIPAKDTEFEGTLDEQFSVMEGKFVFPDGSEHTFKATKDRS